MRAPCAFLVLVAGVGAPRAALGQLDDQSLPGDATAGLEPDSGRTYPGMWWGDLGFFSGDATPEVDPSVEVPAMNATVLTVRAGGSYVLPSAPVAFEAQVGLAALFLSTDEQDTESTWRLMNPLVAAYWAPRFGRFDLRAGVGLGLPFASLRTTGELGVDGILDLSAYLYAAATNGLWDWWAWLPDRLTLLLPTATIDGCLSDNFCVGGAFGIHFLFSTASDETTEGGVTVSTDTGTEAVMQLQGDVAYKSRSTRTGVLLRVVTFLTGEEDPDADDDRSQISLEPYLRFDLGSGFFRAALTVNLDEPFGFSFSGDPLDIWGLHVGGGTQF
jgi:hypothetical protein